MLSVLTRIFGWSMLGALAAYLVNAVLTVSFGWPGPGSVLGGEISLLGLVQLASYAAAIGLALLWVTQHRERSLRSESTAIDRFNAYLVRAAFFTVLYIGLGDMIISALRVEGHLQALLGDELARQLGRSSFRGTYVHLPLMAAGFVTALLTRTLGFIWLSVLIVAAELLIVISRFVYSYEQAYMGDLVRFWYAALFLFASAYTLLEEGHVRVDVFFASFGTRTKGLVNAIGTLLFGMTLCWTILIVGLGSRTSVVYAPLRSFETSQSSYGLYVKYLMAGFLALFAITMLIQFVSYLMSAVADWLDEPGHIDHEKSLTSG